MLLIKKRNIMEKILVFVLKTHIYLYPVPLIQHIQYMNMSNVKHWYAEMINNQ